LAERQRKYRARKTAKEAEAVKQSASLTCKTPKNQTLEVVRNENR
jgi:hypothetical protein